MKRVIAAGTTHLLRTDIGSVHVDGDLAFSNPRLGRLAVSGTTVTLTADGIRLEEVRVGLRVSIRVKAKAGPLKGDVTIGIPPMLPAISLPNLPVPKLETTIDSFSQSGADMEMTVDPLSLAQVAGRAIIEDIRIVDLVLPSSGFEMDGLGVGDVRLGDLHVPALDVGEINLGRLVTQDDIRVPAIRLKNLRIEQPAGDTLTTSSAGITATATVESDEYGGDAGPIAVAVRLKGSLSVTVGRVTLRNAMLRLAVDAVDLEGVEFGLRGRNLRVTPASVAQVAVDRLNLVRLNGGSASGREIERVQV